MKKFALLLSLFSLAAFADGNDLTTNPQATQVAIISIQAATTCVQSSVAAGSQAVATVPAVPGQFFYLTSLAVQLNAIAAPVATLMTTTSTNLPGAIGVSQAMQAAVGSAFYSEAFAVPLKSSLANTATVVSGATGLANVSQLIRVCGFYAK